MSSKADEAARRLLEHDQKRAQLGLRRPLDPLRTAWDRDIEAPAPAFVDPDRPPSTDRSKRAARFRDGPPPPLPADHPSFRPQDNRPTPQLIPQELLDQGGYAPDLGQSTPLAPLTESQKRRLRRKRKRSGAPYPLPQDRELLDRHDPALDQPPDPPEPVYPTNPEVSYACNAVLEMVLNGGPVTFVCPLRPYPHIGQPHLVQLPGTASAPDIFLGWFDADQ